MKQFTAAMRMGVLCAGAITLASAKPSTAAVHGNAGVPADTVTRVMKFVMGVTPGATYAGRCPVNAVFTSVIYVNHGPAAVTYHWERSDGATGPDQTVRITGTNTSHEVRDPWKFGAAGERSTAWERVVVSSPGSKTSGRQTIRVTCNK